MTGRRGIFLGLAVSALVFSGGPAWAAHYHCPPIDYPGASSTEGYSLNAAGQVVGLYDDAGGKAHGFIGNPSRAASSMLLLRLDD